MERRTTFLTLLVAAALLGGCGSNDSGNATIRETPIVTGHGVKGGHLTMYAAADTDYIDPGQTYYQVGYLFQVATNRTLYSYKPQDSVHAIPDLASGPPQISADNRTITVHIRPGIHYAPPLQKRVVKSADIKYAIERAFTQNVPSGYAAIYFGDLVGTPKKPNTAGYAPISGLTTPDDTTLVMRFKKPVAGFVSGALVLPITVPVPKEYAAPFDAKTPSTYDRHVAFTGPYMVRNDSKGLLVGRKPGKFIQLVRNPSWNPKTDYRPAYLDSISYEMGYSDPVVSSRKTLIGKSLLCCDTAAPPAQILKILATRYPGQYQRVAGGGTRWTSLNTRIKPLDNLNVRKAIIAATDRDALRKIYGGPLIGPLATGYIPPGLPGFAEAGGLNQSKGLDFMAYPKGNLAVAKKYMLAARADGVPVSADGKYTGGGSLLVVNSTTPTSRKISTILKQQLGKLGLDLKLRFSPTDTLYTKFCGVPKANVAMCPGIGWVKDFQDAETLFDPTFDGRQIRQEGNTNWSQFDDPGVNAAMDKARLAAGPAARARAWAEVNAKINAQAPTIPQVWDDNFNVYSKNVRVVQSRFLAGPDFDYTYLAGGGS